MSSFLSATKTTKISDKNIFSYVQRGVDMVLFCFSQRSPTFEILCCCSLYTTWEAKQPWKGETLMNSIFCRWIFVFFPQGFPSRIDFLDFPGPGEWIFGARYMFDMHGMLGVLNIDSMHGLVTKCCLYFSPQKKTTVGEISGQILIDDNMLKATFDVFWSQDGRYRKYA